MENVNVGGRIKTAKKVSKPAKPKLSTKQMVMMAMLSAISIVFVTLIHFPLFPAAAFLEYDPADIPILIGTFLYGPVAGLILTVIVSVLQGMTVSAGAGIIGIIMHIIATGSCVCIVGNIITRWNSKKASGIALAVGTVTMTAAMVLLNLILTPLFMGAPISYVISLLVPVIIPFNLLKAGINCFITFLLYQSISHFTARK